MQNPLKMLGDLNKMRQQAAQIQKELAGLFFTASQGRIQVKINGNQQVHEVLIDGQNVQDMVDVINDAIKQSQQAAAGKLAAISQQLGIGQ